jgi:NAD(P)-dependent dehydrogenase (short-subunit alcohol dehydrogenase family)
LNENGVLVWHVLNLSRRRSFVAAECGIESNRMNPEEIDRCIELLSKLAANPSLAVSIDHSRFLTLLEAAGRFSRPNKDTIRLRNNAFYAERRKRERLQDKQARAGTGIREARVPGIFQAPKQIATSDLLSDSKSERVLKFPRNCYICTKEFSRLHFFYDLMCPECAEFNYQKRFQTASLLGQVAVLTGARLKIGYQTGLMLLRAGARVIATTRFPIDAALRYSSEADFDEWKDRLEIHGLDLRHTPSVELFSAYLAGHLSRLDILINNAAQTVRRPPGFYAHLIQNETSPLSSFPVHVQKLLESSETCKGKLSPGATHTAAIVGWQSQTPGIGLLASALLSQIPYQYDSASNTEEIFPKHQYDPDLQQVDLRHTNSWRLRLTEVAAPEMLEVHLVNAVAPFVLCSKLAPIMSRDYTGMKHIVNVSAMEGKFHRFKKADRHPHTNMAKAALNMLTHTSASDLAKKGIYMNAVDTGWVTDEDPIALAKLKQEKHDFQPPLDIVDGAARVCDPFFDGILTGKHWSGKFLKDYRPIDW